ncbi:MAG: nucleotidyltransferase domain-containing protein [Bacillota bacterium]
MSAPRPEIKEIVNRFQKALQAQGINPERVILYGSYAKDTAREGSDIDLIVISRDFAKMNLEQRYARLGAAIAEVMEPIEPLAYTPEEFANLSPLSVIATVARDPAEHVDL